MATDGAPNDFARLIGVHRATRQWTQEALARELGISPEYLSAVVNRKRPASARLVLKMSQVFGLQPNDEQQLLAAAGYGPPPEARSAPGPQARRRGAGLASPVRMIDDDRDNVLAAILERLDALESEIKGIRATVERLRSEETGQ